MLKKLREASKKRDVEWAKDKKLSLSFRGNELAGEAGETCNEIKKLERTRIGLVGGKEDVNGLMEEFADNIICTDLIAMDLNIDLHKAVEESDKISQDFSGLSESFLGNRLAIKAGNICYEIEKIELELSTKSESASLAYYDDLVDSLVDFFEYVSSLAEYFKIDLEDAVKNKFNKTSEKNGLETRL